MADLALALCARFAVWGFLVGIWVFFFVDRDGKFRRYHQNWVIFAGGIKAGELVSGSVFERFFQKGQNLQIVQCSVNHGVLFH